MHVNKRLYRSWESVVIYTIELIAFCGLKCQKSSINPLIHDAGSLLSFISGNTLSNNSMLASYMEWFLEIRISLHIKVYSLCNRHIVKDRAHLSAFKFFIFEKFSCFIVLVVFLVIVQSSELISVWFCEKWHFFLNFISYHISAIYVGGASLSLPTACRLIAVSGARLPSVDGLVVRCIKNAPPC